MVMVKMERTCVTLDKPIYLTGTILDKAKEYMHEFWYDGVMKHLHDPPNSTAELYLTDTGTYI